MSFASFCLLFAHTVDQPISRTCQWQTIASHYSQNSLKKTNSSTDLICQAQQVQEGGEGGGEAAPPAPS